MYDLETLVTPSIFRLIRKTVDLVRTIVYCELRGTGTPKDRDEVNRREVCTSVMGECVIVEL